MEDRKKKGEYYGYPKCCINSFVDPFIKFTERSIEQQNAATNGFIPCAEHAQMIMAGELKIQELILPTREHPVPFKAIKNLKQNHGSSVSRK